MDDIKRILVVSRMTKECGKAVQYGSSLCRKYGAELYVVHVIHEPFVFGAWNLPMPSIEEAFKKARDEAKTDLDKVINFERRQGVTITEVIKDGDPTKEVIDMVKEANIDLMLLLAHEEGRLEHLLFGSSNEAILRKMPCSILFIKNEPEPVAY
jgi:nucleotide-binding universal stress UspA family protein